MSPFNGIVDAWPARSNSNHNPFQSLLTESTESLGWKVREFSPVKSLLRRADIWHWHWPDGQFSQRSRIGAWIRLVALLVLLQRARLTGTPIVWTAHNIRGHEGKNRSVEDRFWPIFYRQVSAVHYLSESSRAAAVQRHPALAMKPSVVTHHGHYKDVYGAPISREEARATLNMDVKKPTIVFCGKVRAYKGVTDLIQAFRQTGSLDAQLVIAGMATREEEELVRAAASSDPRISLNLKLLSDLEVKTNVCAADVVVLPYRKVTNSGSALLALSLDRPLLAANKGSIRELAKEVGSKWVMTYEALSPQVIAAALDASFSHVDGSADLDFCSWRRIGTEVSGLYSEVLWQEAKGAAGGSSKRKGTATSE